uniref:hypothetical protein n=1 Tax=Pedobacter schmidteae TaxID=2201271 RepID=UPI000EB4A616|nr:hypothetical protein [Pedobacter schmidteae]
MKNLLSKLNKTSVFAFVLGLLLIGTQSAFKAVSKLDPPADGWYEITITDLMDPENPEEQAITSTSPQTAPDLENEEACAQTGNSGNKCFVFLEFDEEAEEIPATVDDVDGDLVTITATARQPL